MKVIYSFKTVMISLKNEKFLIPPPHYNFCIVHWLLVRYPGVDVELQEIKQCVKEVDSLANKKISFWQAIQERTFRIPLATFATIFLLLGICGNDTMVFYGPTIAAQVEN